VSGVVTRGQWDKERGDKARGEEAKGRRGEKGKLRKWED